MTERRKGITSLMHNYDFEHASFEGTNHFMLTTACLLCAAYFCSPLCKQDKYALCEQNTCNMVFSVRFCWGSPKIKLNTDLKIILLDHKNNYIERLNVDENVAVLTL